MSGLKVFLDALNRTVPLFRIVRRVPSLRTRQHLREVIQFFCLGGILPCLVCSSLAQVDRAGLNGTVTDPFWARFAENACHCGAQCHRIATGNHPPLLVAPMTFPNCPLAIYTVTFTHAGFNFIRLWGQLFSQTVGQTRTLNATLPIGRPGAGCGVGCFRADKLKLPMS